jgi:uncharacterized protein (DUF983 family)
MKLLKKGSKLYSILNNKCPQCQEGDFFYSHPYDINQLGKKHINCPNCKLKFEREPGFFYGSMYISYAVGVGIFVAWWIVKTLLFPTMEAGMMVLIMAFLQIALAPLSMYASKLIWLNLFMSYNN